MAPALQLACREKSFAPIGSARWLAVEIAARYSWFRALGGFLRGTFGNRKRTSYRWSVASLVGT